MQARIHTWWLPRERTILTWALLVLAVDALVFTSYELWRLLLEHHHGARDLNLRAIETRAWFAGDNVYARFGPAVYPPATYALLWPFVGWVHFGLARWLWGAVLVGCLAWFGAQLIRESGASDRLTRGLVAAVLLATYPAGQTLGNGQLLLATLPLLVAAVLMVRRGRLRPHEEVLVALLLVAALVKPTAALPFLVLAFVLRRGWRPVLLSLAAYAALTLLALSYQDAGLRTLFDDWKQRSTDTATDRGAELYANVHSLLGALGWPGAILPVSLAILAAFAVWVFRHREADLWLLLGITALVARFWTYHRSYDDLLILLPAVALLRLARRGDVLAGLLFAATLVSMLAPDALFVLPYPLTWVFTGFETLLWLGLLAFLVHRTHSERVPARAALEPSG